jgi:predicted RNase H-like HicB family nuclease
MRRRRNSGVFAILARMVVRSQAMKQRISNRRGQQTLQVSVRVPALIHPEPKAGGYSAEVPSRPGCYTQGGTLQEVETNLREAIEGWLGVAHDEAATTPNDREAATVW